ncbi:MAG: hypothetical protein HOO91_21510 [Bacteroidales bacterium]|nr:hypothetical protein [Bacteroidales bacterium]
MAKQPKNENQFSKRIGFFKNDLKSNVLQNAFNNLYEEKGGNWAAIKPELTEEKGFNPDTVKNLEFTHNLAQWGNENENLISIFQKDNQTNSMRDIALKFNKATFIEKVKVSFTAKTEVEKNTLSVKLYNELFQEEPTAMLVNMVKDPQIPILNNAIGGYTADIFGNHPDFNIKTDSIYNIICDAKAFENIPVENHEDIIAQMKILKRITGLSPIPDAIPVLYNAKLYTSMQISATPPKQFVKMMVGKGLDENVLMQIHANAQHTRVRNEQMLIALREAYTGTGIDMIDKSLCVFEDKQENQKDNQNTARYMTYNSGSVESKPLSVVSGIKINTKLITEFYDHFRGLLKKNNLSWDLLFGDADFCECGECNSVYSPAAYFVELLQYLRNNNLDPENPFTELKGIVGTPLEKFFNRRPDLRCLELTCKNTNTILPYVDLVNEVMENYVASKSLKPYNVDDETSSELLAEPQHTTYKAYCMLKNAVYPFTLPYHQPIDATRIYLNYLDTSRYELIKTFRVSNSGNDQNLSNLKDEVVNKAVDAEFLGITKEEYIILTKECFIKNELKNILDDKNYSYDEYKSKIGVKPDYEYYGYHDEATMRGDEGLTLIKKEFLRRTGIEYKDLTDLIKTEFINPLLPKGKSKIIMESLRFSYRFLQNYAKMVGGIKMAEDLVKLEKFADLFSSFKENVEIMIGKKTLRCPNQSKEHLEISEKDLVLWAKCNFKKVGEMIVIETGTDYSTGTIFYSHIITTNNLGEKQKKEIGCIEDYQIFYYADNNDSVKIGDINRITGEIILDKNQQSIYSKFKLVNLSFVGHNGERGIFWFIEYKLHLIFIEQKDNCNINTALLQHLDGTPLYSAEYDKIQRFIRLWRKLGWTIDETDKAIVALSTMKNNDEKTNNTIIDTGCGGDSVDECNDDECDECNEENRSKKYDINPELIHQLAAVKKILDKTGLELIKLLTFWGPISTAGEKSLYQRLFLTHNMLGIDDVFKADEKGDFLSKETKLLDHVPVVMAALNLSADDILAIKEEMRMADKLTLENLSILYRFRLLSKVLGLRIPAFILVLKIFGDVFKDADSTLKFLKTWGKMEDAGFTHQQLNYIINDIDDEKKPFTPSKKEILLLSKTLYDGLNAIDETHKDLVADSKITDSSLQEKNIQEQATSELVRTKAGLIFETETVDKIIGLLEGTIVFKTNAPYNLDFTFVDVNKEKHDKLAETATLKNKLKYDKVGSIQITGILTDAEINTYKLFANDTDLKWNIDPTTWTNALTRIQNQQAKLFNELLSGVFDSNTTLADDVKANLKKDIKEGDVSVSLDKLAENENDPNTAPRKRVAFLTIFLPYLRQQLSHRFVSETLTNFTGLEAKITDILVSQILCLNDKPIYDLFEKIKQSAKQGETSWNGYLAPTVDSDYTIIVKNSNSKPQIIFENIELNYVQQDEPTDEWWSGDNPHLKQLQTGRLYKIAIKGIDLKNIYWKTLTSSITQIPLSVLIPDFTSDECKPALTKLVKASMLISTFSLGRDEILFFENHKVNFANLDFNNLTLEHWLRLEAYVRLRNSLPQSKLNMLDFWKWTNDNASEATELCGKIADLTSWKKERIEKLIDKDHFNLTKLEDYLNEINLLKLQKALAVADKIGIHTDLLFKWAAPGPKFRPSKNIAYSIKNAIRAKYNQTDWEQVAKPLHDKLRNNQRDALIGFLLQQDELKKWEVTDADGLFEYFLIDVQMDAVMETSRIKQAISSVQLFIQRCFLGLEEEHNNISPNILDRNRWEWMQRYRVWEANRKVFLYPENWIESHLRDDKSPFFRELESELLQKDITKQNVTDALKAYLYKVDEVANMEVVGLYIEGEREREIIQTQTQWSKGSKLHVFSRTRNAPYFFYYRYLELDTKNWYPWEKMQVDIPTYDVEYSFFRKIFENSLINLKKILPQNYESETKFLRSISEKKGNQQYLMLKTTDLTDENRSELNKVLENNDLKNILFEKIHDNGCFLTPVVWNNRLLIFFPQIMKKTKPNPASSSGSYNALGNNEKGIENSKPIEYYEIKMTWSEYRNGKWTQKQLSKDAIDSCSIDSTHDIQYFKFIPVIYDEKIIINVDDFLDNDGDYRGAFEFNGTVLNVIDEINTEPISIDYFNQANGKLYSWQMVSDSTPPTRQYTNIYFEENTEKKELLKVLNNSEINFYHPYTHDLLGKINTSELKDFFNYKMPDSDFPSAFGFYDPDGNSSTKNAIYHELKCPYSLYNWELFFHTPILLADALSKAQHFEEAMKWYHFVFNPLADGYDDMRFWQFLPFKNINSQRVLDGIFNNLKPNTPDSDITEWRDKPFMPHVVARSRPVAYMKWVVMKYIDNIIEWGDYLFRQDTIESINQATQLYILAGHIMGPKPMMIPKRGRIKPQTYLNLLDKWDAFGNAMIEMETIQGYSNQTTLPINFINNEIVLANIYGTASSLYFCIPNNPKLMGYWDTIADRLYKIRHCQNIEGVFRKLPLFEPPIDPALLVKAVAQGLSIASVLNDLNTPMPNYRFYYLLQKALELCNELKSLGGALLSAIEKKDNETIALIRAKHDGVMQNLVMEIKKKQLDEAQKNLESLQQNRKGPEERMKYYLKLSGKEESLVPSDTSEFNGIPNDIVTVNGDSGLKLIKYEKEEMDKADEARQKQVDVGKKEFLASILHLLPTASIDAKPIGIGIGFQFGGPFLGGAMQAWAKYLQNDANEISYKSTNAGKKGGFTRALQERIFQANAAGYELKQIDKQITAQQIRIEIANQEIANQQKAIDNANEMEEFIKNKYTNEELYTWMRGSLKTLYHQVYNLAYELAKKAEKTYCFERGISSSNFIQAGYFDAGRDGLLAGEQLYVGLKQLEAAYQNERGHDYEITKHISLRQINPLALIELRENGKCEFAFPEVLFDMDYPGHYKRRIKTVSISIPCIVGPYTGINATFSLLENKFRNTAIGGKKYEEDTEETDTRFTTYNIPIRAIAASTAQNESGMHELNFKDERYLPFEGAGVISWWRIELPEVKQFDYQTISDVIIHVRYTSSEGGERLKKSAIESVQKFMNANEELAKDQGLFTIIDLKHDMTSEWNKTFSSEKVEELYEMDLSRIKQFLPFYLNSAEQLPVVTDVIIATDSSVINDYKLNEKPFANNIEMGKLHISSISEEIKIDEAWSLQLPKSVKDAKQCHLIVRMTK